MKIATYELQQRALRSVAPPRITPRVVVDATQGGAVVHRSAGARAEAVWTLPFTGADAMPRRTVIHSFVGTLGIVDSVIPGEAMAGFIPVAADGFAGISVVNLALSHVGGIGYLSVELWDDNGGPGEKIGVLGQIALPDIIPVAPASYAVMEIWCDVAWPLLSPGGWLVLNATGMTAGTASWWGRPFPGMPVGYNAFGKYTPLGGWALDVYPPYLRAWQGGLFLILRGFAQAYCHDGGRGPEVWDLEDDSGQLYEVICLDVDGEYGWKPLSADQQAFADGVRMDLVVVRAKGDYELTP